MRVLAVSYALPPALYPQAIQIGRLLAHCRGEIGVVCGVLDGPARLDTDFGLGARLVFRVEVGFAPKLSNVGLALARRFVPFYARVPDEFRPWVSRAEKATVAQLAASCFRPDLLVTFGEPMSDHLIGLRLNQRLKLPWIAHFSDPWVDHTLRRHDWLANVVNRRLEKAVIQKADHVVFTSQETLDLIMQKYPACWRDKASVLPHSFDPALCPSAGPREKTIVVRHIGNFYGDRTPVPLFRALKLMLENEPQALADTRIELVGQLSRRFRKHPSLGKLPLELLKLIDTVAYSESLQLMSNSDLLLIVDTPDKISVLLLSKLIDYLGSGVPIFGIVPAGPSATLLERYGALIAHPQRPDEIAQGLTAVLRLVRERRRSSVPAPWGNAAVRSEFQINRVARTFSDLLEDVAAKCSEGRQVRSVETA
jgi:glycosyltransferase involved in cell wall biosynthesis